MSLVRKPSAVCWTPSSTKLVEGARPGQLALAVARRPYADEAVAAADADALDVDELESLLAEFLPPLQRRRGGAAGW